MWPVRGSRLGAVSVLRPVCSRYFEVPKRLREAYDQGELSKVGAYNTTRQDEAEMEKHDEDASVVLDPIAHTKIDDPYAEEEFFDDWLVRCAVAQALLRP